MDISPFATSPCVCVCAPASALLLMLLRGCANQCKHGCTAASTPTHRKKRQKAVIVGPLMGSLASEMERSHRLGQGVPVLRRRPNLRRGVGRTHTSEIVCAHALTPTLCMKHLACMCMHRSTYAHTNVCNNADILSSIRSDTEMRDLTLLDSLVGARIQFEPELETRPKMALGAAPCCDLKL